jgi:capsular exopolysaccharide synthesis family protein
LLAASLAIAFAETGRKVALVDANLRAPVLHEHFGLERSPGLADAITQGLALGSVLRETHVPGLSLITSGTGTGNPGALLGSQQATAAIAALRDLAELVVIDAPPVVPVPDAQLAARSCDAAVLILSRATKRHIAQDAVAVLRRTGTTLTGLIRNRVASARALAHVYGTPENPA